MSNTVVALLFGGKSSEHEISIISAKAIAAHIDKKNYTPYPLYISRDGKWFMGRTAQAVLDLDMAGLLKKQSLDEIGAELLSLTRNCDEDLFSFNFRKEGIDVAFPVLHGTYGEDGKVQGLLEVFGIPYTGCSVQASAITIDKDVAKICAMRAGIAVAEYMSILSADYLKRPSLVIDMARQRFTPPFFVKPANLGSSVGISKIHAFNELPGALDEACKLDIKVLVEKAVSGREVEVAVLGNEDPIASAPGEIEPGNDFYDYTDKYISNTAKLHIPARIDIEVQKALQHEAIRAYRALGCSGMSRVDFFVENKSNRIILNEINTIPGFTGTSMYPLLMKNTGIGFKELIDTLLQLALEKSSV